MPLRLAGRRLGGSARCQRQRAVRRPQLDAGGRVREQRALRAVAPLHVRSQYGLIAAPTPDRDLAGHGAVAWAAGVTVWVLTASFYEPGGETIPAVNEEALAAVAIVVLT